MARRPNVPAEDVRLIRELGAMRREHQENAARLSNEAAHQRIEALKLTDELIAEKFGVGKDCISKILRGESHKGI